MADYDGNWIFQLDQNRPQGTESKSLGDNAITEIKRALKNAFPNSPVGDSYGGTLSQLTGLVANAIIPRDLIAMWSGSIDNVPAGWSLCDGTPRDNGGGANAPNLQGKFIVGTNPFAPTGTTGGSAEIQIRNANGTLKVFNTSATALTVQNLPNFSSNLQIAMDGDSQSDNHSSTAVVARGRPSTGSTQVTTPLSVTGATGTGHSHTFVVDSLGVNPSQSNGPNLPPYYALAYIIKD